MSLIAELKRRNVFRVAIAYGVLCWLIMQIADVLIGTLELPTLWGKAVLSLLALGFLPVVIFSWVYEMTPEGLKREADIPREQSITAHTAKKLDLVVILLLVLAMGMFAVDRFVVGSGPTVAVRGGPVADADGRASIAVLPFTNMSGNPENEYFSDGLTETLLHMLAQVDNLRVAARTSAFAFKNSNTDIREIAAQLNVSAVLEGSVQRSGQRVRITAQLIDAGNGSHLWSQNFDRDLDDIFAIQDEIANAVARALTVSLLGEQAAAQPTSSTRPIESVSTNDTSAYDHYLRGLEYLRQDSYATLTEAERHFKEAVVTDPEFREARIQLTFTYLVMGDTALITNADAVSRGRAALAPLLSEADSDPVVRAYDIFLDYLQKRNDSLLREEGRLGFFSQLATSIARAPNEPEMYVMAAEILSNVQGREQERLEYIERGLQIDPLNTELWSWKGRVLGFDLNRPEEALQAFGRITELEPTNANGHGLSGFVHHNLGNYARAAQSYALGAAIDRQDHELPAFVALAIMDTGLVEEARPWVERAELLNPSGGASVRARLQYLFVAGALDEVEKLSESVLRARDGNRRLVYDIAAMLYARVMEESGRTGEALALLEELSPGSTTDFGYVPDNPYSLRHIFTAWTLQAGGYDEAQRAQWREARIPMLDQLVPDWREDPDAIINRYLFGIEDLSSAASGLAENIREHDYQLWDRIDLAFRSRQPLLDHPSVRAAIEQARQRLDEQAGALRRMIAAGEIPGG